MTFLSHTFSGIAVGAITSQITGVDHYITIPVCIAFSIAPDINIFWRKITEHHRDFTHYPFFWLIMVLAVFIIEYFLQSTTFVFTLSLFMSSAVHLILDTFGIGLGVHWMAPFSHREFSFTSLDKSKLEKTNKEKLRTFYKSGYILYELGVISIAILVVLGILYIN